MMVVHNKPLRILFAPEIIITDLEMQLRMSKACCNELKQFNKELIDALRLIQKDMHQFSKRPCSTCKTISLLIHEPFGCVIKANERKI